MVTYRCQGVFYLKTLLQEITGQNSGFPFILKTDSRNLYDAVHSTKTLEDRRLKIDICSLRQKLAKGEIQTIEWIRKDYQLADCLTKLEAPTSKLIEVLPTLRQHVLILETEKFGSPKSGC